MRQFVQKISAYTQKINPDFLIIPQNGQELLTIDGTDTGTPAIAYIKAIHGLGREDLFYGYDGDNIPTPESVRNRIIPFLNLAESCGIEVLVIDYCSTRTFVDNSNLQNTRHGYISFVADHRELDNIPAYPPEPHRVNASDITTLKQAQNFLCLINHGAFRDKTAFLNALSATNYDLLIIDLFYDTLPLTADEIARLKTKANGGRRLILSYLSIGEAEDYRYYWRPEWQQNPPDWLLEQNPDWPGNYRVKYWDPQWQKIIYGNDNSYVKKILTAGFDGIYLDLIDAFEYFEQHETQ